MYLLGFNFYQTKVRQHCGWIKVKIVNRNTRDTSFKFLTYQLVSSV